MTTDGVNHHLLCATNEKLLDTPETWYAGSYRIPCAVYGEGPEISEHAVRVVRAKNRA